MGLLLFWAHLATLSAWTTVQARSTSRSAVSKTNVLSMDPSSLYNLPTNFSGNVSQSFLQTSSFPTQELLKPFISYSDEFSSLLAPNATLELLYADPEGRSVAHEMGIWVWDHNQVWMASSNPDGSSNAYILDLSSGNLTSLQPSNGIPVINPNGGGYFGGKVYIAGDGNATFPPCIYAIDPETYEVEIVVDSYFGLRLNGPNDLTWVTQHSRNGTATRSWLFFTDDPLSSIYNGGPAPQLPDATWRYDPVGKTLLPVLDRTDVLVPNGIRTNKAGNKLYITDTPNPLVYGAGVVVSGDVDQFAGSQSSGIYEFDIDEDARLSNKRLFGIAQRGIADGVHLDDSGRVWTGEADGVVVRNPTGTVLGMFNALAIQGIQTVDSDQAPLANFALAGDRVIILAYDKIFSVRLSHSIVSGMT
ncbi:hypothetical protein BX600DRAFT_155797 [Xylariales sp. PMI_506]|nr:hypothetical protein BX600DRAFT_155797 [Xylariales sp. PMI_506]